MFDNDYENSSQLVLSRELLTLLRWLVENEAPKIQRLVEKAMQSGLDDQIRKELNDTSFPDVDAEAHVSIIEFLGLLEASLFESMKESTTRKAAQKKLMPAIDQIDGTICDNATVRSSVEKAIKHINTPSSDEGSKESFFQKKFYATGSLKTKRC
jgi:hypothetical protein